MQESDFYEVAEEFINFANELAEEWAHPFLSAVFMYSAARFNAHNFHLTDGDPEKEQQAIEYYTSQYRKMLSENIKELRPSDEVA
jgi:hypothetical protein